MATDSVKQITCCNSDEFTQQQLDRPSANMTTTNNQVNELSQAQNTAIESIQRTSPPEPASNMTHDMPTTPDTTKAATFLSLPPEIRNVIYEHCFHDLYITIKQTDRIGTYDGSVNGQPRPNYAWNDHDIIAMPEVAWSLLESNKTIALEARSVLFASATFVFLNAETFINYSRAMHVSALPLKIRLPGDTEDSSNPFNHIERLWLDLTESGDMPGLTQDEQQTRAAVVRSHEVPLLQSLTQRLPALKHLSITIKPSCDMFMGGSPLGPMRKRPLRAICQLKDLESFSIAVAPVQLAPGIFVFNEHVTYIVAKLNSVLAKHVVKNVSNGTTTHRLTYDGCSSLELQLRVVAQMVSHLGRVTPPAVMLNLAQWQLLLEDEVWSSRKEHATSA